MSKQKKPLVVEKMMTTANMGVMSREALSSKVTHGYPGNASRVGSKTKKSKKKK